MRSVGERSGSWHKNTDKLSYVFVSIGDVEDLPEGADYSHNVVRILPSRPSDDLDNDERSKSNAETSTSQPAPDQDSGMLFPSLTLAVCNSKTEAVCGQPSMEKSKKKNFSTAL